ncbi:MAG: hypothetical protein AAGD28_05875 [Bacteroidota bacterium]
MADKNPKEEIQEELEELKALEIFDADYKRKKLITYAVRTFVAILLFGSFWDLEWVRWIGIAYIPVNLIGLCMILAPQLFMSRSLKKLSKKITELEEEMEGEVENTDENG